MRAAGSAGVGRDDLDIMSGMGWRTYAASAAATLHQRTRPRPARNDPGAPGEPGTPGDPAAEAAA